MSIRYIQSSYGKLNCQNVLKFLFDVMIVNIEDVQPYVEGTKYKKGDYVHLKENGIHKIYRCKVDVSSDTFVPDEWEHVMDIYDEEVKSAGSLNMREEVIIVDKNNIDNIIIPGYKPGNTIITIFIGKDILIEGKDFIVDENGKITFIPPDRIEIGDKIIIEIKETIGLPDRLIILSSNGNNYEIGVIDGDVFIIASDLVYSKPEIYIKDNTTGEVYRIFMLDEDIYYELSDVYTSQTEIKILDVDQNEYMLEMSEGEIFFSPKN